MEATLPLVNLDTNTSIVKIEQVHSSSVPGRQFSKIKVKQREKTLKLVVFMANELYFALRIESVHKVVNQTRVIYSNEAARVGIAHVGDFEITVIDIQEKLMAQVSPSLPFQSFRDNNQYLIIAQGTSEELIGIPTQEAPILMEVALSQIRALPESYRRAGQLNIASHITLISQETEEITVFLMDIDRLLSQIDRFA